MNDVSPIVATQTAGLPKPVADDLLEAARCWSFGAYRGAALLARRAVEQAAVMRRMPLEMRTLHQKIGWLLQEGHLPRDLVADARTVRDVGTAAAHGGEAVTSDEAHVMVSSALVVVSAVLATGE